MSWTKIRQQPQLLTVERSLQCARAGCATATCVTSEMVTFVVGDAGRYCHCVSQSKALQTCTPCSWSPGWAEVRTGLAPGACAVDKRNRVLQRGRLHLTQRDFAMDRDVAHQWLSRPSPLILLPAPPALQSFTCKPQFFFSRNSRQKYISLT